MLQVLEDDTYIIVKVTMLKWFASNPAGKATCLPMLLSAFSHYSIFHLGI